MNVAHDRRFGWNIKLNKARELEPWVVTKVSSAGSVLNINRDGKLDVNGKKKTVRNEMPPIDLARRVSGPW